MDELSIANKIEELSIVDKIEEIYQEKIALLEQRYAELEHKYNQLRSGLASARNILQDALEHK